jgi:uncharacterized protein YlxW (UPF0749 family)
VKAARSSAKLLRALRSHLTAQAADASDRDDQERARPDGLVRLIENLQHQVADLAMQVDEIATRLEIRRRRPGDKGGAP